MRAQFGQARGIHAFAQQGALRPLGAELGAHAEMPYTRQTAIGWSHQINPSTVFTEFGNQLSPCG